MVSVIIPAYNEEGTIGSIIESISGHPRVAEIIIVDDGSSDGTALAAESAGARVIRQTNAGKAAAMEAGVNAAASEIILFLDADVVGLTHEKISAIIGPVCDERLEMHVGILDRPLLLTKRFFYVLPVLSGMRALTKTLWHRVPSAHKRGFKIEIALNHAARKWGKGTGYEIIYGLTHTTKEKKHGLVPGLWRRIKMIAQIAHISFLLYIWEPSKGTLREKLQAQIG